ncbi:hypothetical protein [Aeromicrobium chenweiae]|uniref:Uncharacterized protein n=1 Tax=Aeromicrobium chenweiae TaxID=2079793 RepID=A0A2S0WHK8_9ACTN|nr:hypothetical protein [Aeromicrobium chenweiae]AWB90819.1 hypothetical protein C3E78_00415 [Aeromicrobium chenweiae]TGN31082.1 hypothetical protein E4L97_15885 [Aeromicrobium chenweiae]
MSSTVQGGRRRLDASVPPEYDLPTREPRIESARTARLLLWVVFVAWVVGTAGAATSIIAIGAPTWIERPSAALLTVVFAVGLTHRGGGHMRIWLPITAALAIAAAALETNLLLASAAAVSAVLSAVWAVMVTRPADSVVGAMREYALALVVALSGTLSVAAWNAPVNYQRFNLIVVSVALGLAITMVWNLGAGLHGLGRQNLAILAGVAVLLLVILAYSSFVRTHGSDSLVDLFSDLVSWSRRTFEGVPRPVEVFIGFPALIVGVSMRSKRREGWWVLVFAVIGTAVLTTSLVTPGAFPTYIALSTLYSSILGLAVGLVVRHYVLRERSARAARAIEPIVRVEPPRFAPLK